jgi:hypothetical protein
MPVIKTQLRGGFLSTCLQRKTSFLGRKPLNYSKVITYKHEFTEVDLKIDFALQLFSELPHTHLDLPISFATQVSQAYRMQNYQQMLKLEIQIDQQ